MKTEESGGRHGTAVKDRGACVNAIWKLLLGGRGLRAIAAKESGGGGDRGATAGKQPRMVLAAADARLGHRADPAFAAHAEPIGYWAAAVCDNLMPRRRMANSVMAAKRVLTCAKRPWAAVKGPAAAMVASAARLGWTIIDALTTVTDAGEEIVMNRDPPAMVKKKVHEAVRRWRWKGEGAAVSMQRAC